MPAPTGCVLGEAGVNGGGVVILIGLLAAVSAARDLGDALHGIVSVGRYLFFGVGFGGSGVVGIVSVVGSGRWCWVAAWNR